jgi:DNA-directed RNA polymerase specialized sigma24 family protein
LNPAVADDLLERVRKAAAKADAAEASRQEAREQLRQAVVEAHEGGHSYTAIGRVLGVSRQRVAELVQQERS